MGVEPIVHQRVKPLVSTTCLLVPKYSHTTFFFFYFSFQLTPSRLLFFPSSNQ